MISRNMKLFSDMKEGLSNVVADSQWKISRLSSFLSQTGFLVRRKDAAVVFSAF